MAGLPPNLKLQVLDLLLKHGNIGDNDALSEVLASPAGPASTEKMGPPPKVFGVVEEDKLDIFTADQLQQLTTQGYIVIDSFLGKLQKRDTIVDVAAGSTTEASDKHEAKDTSDGARLSVDTVAAEMQQYLKEGKLRPAGMSGTGASYWKNHESRGDLMTWLHRSDASSGLGQLLDHMDAIRLELNTAAAFKSDRMQIQLAHYPANGSRYVRHKDSFPGGPQRRLTVLYYANGSDWDIDRFGGQLRLYLPSGVKDIAPCGDRIVVFLSEWLEHEVMPCRADRFSITTWFY